MAPVRRSRARSCPRGAGPAVPRSKPAERGPGFLPRLHSGDAGVAEDPRQRRRRRNRSHAEGSHLLVNTDRPVIQTGALQSNPNRDRLSLDRVRNPVRARPRPSGSRLECCRLALIESPPSYRVKRLPRDPVLGAESAHRPPRRIRRPLRNRETDTRINRLGWAHPSNIEGSVTTRTPERLPIY